jgi:hypothetical protein
MAQTLNQQELKTEITKALESMGCSDILFLDSKDDLLVAVFNCKELTSFKLELPGWKYSGIQLDSTHTRQYKIEFVRIK